MVINFLGLIVRRRIDSIVFRMKIFSFLSLVQSIKENETTTLDNDNYGWYPGGGCLWYGTTHTQIYGRYNETTPIERCEKE